MESVRFHSDGAVPRWQSVHRGDRDATRLDVSRFSRRASPATHSESDGTPNPFPDTGFLFSCPIQCRRRAVVVFLHLCCCWCTALWRYPARQLPQPTCEF